MSSNGKLRVVGVTVKHVLGAVEWGMEPGKLNLLRGRNGSGKSTALKAVQRALEGGNLAKLQNVNAGPDDEAEVVLVLEGNGEEYRVEKSGNKTAKVLARVGDTAAFETVPRPQEFLSSVFDPKGCNPVTFLTAKTDELALLLLEALDLKLDRAELDGIVGDLKQHVPDLPPGLHPLVEVDLVRDGIFRARTGINRDQKNKAAAADQTRRNAPAKIPTDPKQEIAIAEKRVAELTDLVARQETKAQADESAAIEAADATQYQEATRLEGAFKADAGKIRADFDRAAAELRAQAERAIAGLKVDADRKVADLTAASESALAAADKAKEEATAEARRAREASRFATEAQKRDLGTLRERLATLRAQAEEAARAKALHEQAKEFDRESESLKGESDGMSAAIEALDAFKRRLAEELPIPGIEIAGKEVKVHGVPWDQLNTAQRIDVSVRIACIRAKAARLPVLFVDGAEALDTDAFAEFMARVAREDVQLFCARVEARDLAVETREAVTA